MNNLRRTALRKCIEQANELISKIEEVSFDEQMAFDNLPESFQESSKGDAYQEAIENLSSAVESINDAISYIEDSI